MSDEVVKKNTAITLLAGTLLGAGIVLLLPPQSGRQTRRKIRRFAKFAGDHTQAAQRELQRSLGHIIEDTEEKLQSGLTSGMEWTESKLGEKIEKIQSI